MTSVAPTMTGAKPRPSSANHTDSRAVPVPGSREDRPKQPTAAQSMPTIRGMRGPIRLISAPAAGEATIIMAVRGSRCRPLSTGVMPCTFCR